MVRAASNDPAPMRKRSLLERAINFCRTSSAISGGVSVMCDIHARLSGESGQMVFGPVYDPFVTHKAQTRQPTRQSFVEPAIAGEELHVRRFHLAGA